MKNRIIVCGAAGRMGRRIVAMGAESGDFELAGAVESRGNPHIGADAGITAGIGENSVIISDGFSDSADVDVVIDFSLPQAAEATIDYCVENGCSLVMGTTGLDGGQLDKIKKAGEKIAVIYGTNMSVGMNVLFELAARAADMLGEDYDVEIVEQHHRFKKDSPSGSAMTLAERICEQSGRKFPQSLVHGRSGKDALREKGTIGMHAVRAGDITGIHSVIFGTLGETVTLNHNANNRDNFVSGALRAAKWLAGKKAGSYSMADVLSLR